MTLINFLIVLCVFLLINAILFNIIIVTSIVYYNSLKQEITY